MSLAISSGVSGRSGLVSGIDVEEGEEVVGAVSLEEAGGVLLGSFLLQDASANKAMQQVEIGISVFTR